MNTLLDTQIAHLDFETQIDPGSLDVDIAAIVEDFLRAQLDPTVQLDPNYTARTQLDPGGKAQLDSGVNAQLDPSV